MTRHPRLTFTALEDRATPSAAPTTPVPLSSIIKAALPAPAVIAAPSKVVTPTQVSISVGSVVSTPLSPANNSPTVEFGIKASSTSPVAPKPAVSPPNVTSPLIGTVIPADWQPGVQYPMGSPLYRLVPGVGVSTAPAATSKATPLTPPSPAVFTPSGTFTTLAVTGPAAYGLVTGTAVINTGSRASIPNPPTSKTTAVSPPAPAVYTPSGSVPTIAVTGPSTSSATASNA